MVQFDRPPLEFVAPEIPEESAEALTILFDTTVENILSLANALAENTELSRLETLGLSSSVVLHAAIRSAFLAIGAEPEQLKKELITECIKMLVEKLHKEL